MSPAAAPLVPSPPAEEQADLARRAHAALGRARAHLVLREPFFGHLAMRLRPQADFHCRQLWTDGKTLGFHPAFADGLPQDRLVGALAHEILHIACGHHARRGQRSSTLWNEACDVVINDLLLEAGFRLPEGFLHRPDLSGRSVDAVYAQLLQEKSAGHATASPQQKGQAHGAGEAKAAREIHAASGRAGRSPQKDAPHDSEMPEAGTVRPGYRPAPKQRQAIPVFNGEVRDAPELQDGQADSTDLLHQVARDVQEALRRARHAGRIPAGLDRLCHRKHAPARDWAGLLRRFLAHHAQNDYTWCSPSRRYLHQGLYLPGRRDVRIPCLAIALDCSGSVDDRMLSAFLGEMENALQPYDAEVVVLCHDSRLQSVTQGQGRDVLRHVRPRGGGGTDYRPVGNWLRQEGRQPACLIWFTDLECDTFPEETPCPTLWLVWGDTARRPPFGECVLMSATT